jgi:dynein heavy chain
MGFQIPETALNVTLQEEKYHEVREALHTMLQHYKTANESLTDVEKTLFSKKLKQMRDVLEPGYSPLNWWGGAS